MLRDDSLLAEEAEVEKRQCDKELRDLEVCIYIHHNISVLLTFLHSTVVSPLLVYVRRQL